MNDARRIGTGEVRFERIRYDGPDDPQGLPRPGGRLRVELVVTAHRRVKIGSLAVRVSMPGGPVLVAADPVIDSDLPLELDVGTHRLQIEIESLVLSPGQLHDRAVACSWWRRQGVVGLRLHRGCDPPRPRGRTGQRRAPRSGDRPVPIDPDPARRR